MRRHNVKTDPQWDVLNLLVLQLVLPEELLHDVGHSLHAGDCVALVVEVEKIPGLSTQRKEEPNALGSSGQNIQILIKTVLNFQMVNIE